MDQFLGGYALFVAVVRQALFWLAVVAALVALVDWLVRTRRLNPFGPVARFFRRFVDPALLPMERRITRAGGLPTSAPWWTLVAVIVGGLVLLWVLELIGGMAGNLVVGLESPGGLARVLLGWVFDVVRVALFVRVISSWFGMSPYSRWIRWSYVLTEWMLAPLRRVVPTMGPLDITPIIAFFLLSIAQRLLGL